MSDELVITAPGPTTLQIVAETTAFLEFEAAGLPGAAGKDAAGISCLTFSRLGGMYVSTGSQHFPFAYPFTALSLSVTLGVAPTGDDFVLVLNRNGAPWVTATVPAGQTSVLVAIDEDLADGDDLTVDVTSVGSSEPGQDLTAILWTKAIAA